MSRASDDAQEICNAAERALESPQATEEGKAELRLILAALRPIADGEVT